MHCSTNPVAFHAMRRPLLATLVLLLPVLLASQSPTVDLIQQARTQMSANALDSAAALLRTAMASATQRSDSVNAYTWRGILAFMQGSDSATRMEFHHALQLDSSLQVPGLEQASPRLARVVDHERLELRPRVSFVSGGVDARPRPLSGPPVVYPPAMLRRQVRGQALVGLTVDTLGHAEERSIVIVATPDSGMTDALRSMVLASTFSPGRIHGRKVRTLIELAIDLTPGAPPSATSLVMAARARLAAHQTDSALVLLQVALDPLTRATEGERVYAQLVQGIAWTGAGRDTLARAAVDSALAGYQRLTARGVELAPFLKRLADSVRLARTGRGPGQLGTPAVIEAVDVRPAPLTYPAIVYPPEMQALRIGGTVVVEARVDATGDVLARAARVG